MRSPALGLGQWHVAYQVRYITMVYLLYLFQLNPGFPPTIYRTYSCLLKATSCETKVMTLARCCPSRCAAGQIATCKRKGTNSQCNSNVSPSSNPKYLRKMVRKSCNSNSSLYSDWIQFFQPAEVQDSPLLQPSKSETPSDLVKPTNKVSTSLASQFKKDGLVSTRVACVCQQTWMHLFIVKPRLGWCQPPEKMRSFDQGLVKTNTWKPTSKAY